MEEPKSQVILKLEYMNKLKSMPEIPELNLYRWMNEIRMLTDYRETSSYPIRIIAIASARRAPKNNRTRVREAYVPISPPPRRSDLVRIKTYSTIPPTQNSISYRPHRLLSNLNIQPGIKWTLCRRGKLYVSPITDRVIVSELRWVFW